MTLAVFQPEIQGRWVNQNGSTLVVDSIQSGRVQGSFESRKGRAAAGIEYPLVGFQNGELVSFLVCFQSEEGNLNSITSFSGRWERSKDGIERIHTIWVLARQFEDAGMTKPTQVWNTFLTNSDVFVRIQ